MFLSSLWTDLVSLFIEQSKDGKLGAFSFFMKRML